MDLVELAADLRDKGMSLASLAQDAKSPCWSERAYEALIFVARMQPYVHVDDLLRVFSDKPVHTNAWGPVWARAIKEHMIVHSGRVRPCTDPTKHRHQSPVYMSLVYRREP